MQVDYIVKTVLSALSSDAVIPLRKLFTIDGGIQLLGKFISTMVDPSTVTLEQIKEERKKGSLSSKHNWRF